MAIVVDASIVIGAVSPDEGLPHAMSCVSAAFERGAISPALFVYEVENVLVGNERRGNLNRSDRERASRVIAGLPIDIRAFDPERVRAKLAPLAARAGQTVYDAAYLDLAVESGAALTTLDRRLIAAALAEGVQVLKP